MQFGEKRYRSKLLLPLRLALQVSESEGEDEEAVDKVVELVRSPKPTSPTQQNGDADDDVFLFDNNIPSIATRISTSAEPGDTLALRRRNRLLRLISDSRRVNRQHGALQRSVSDQLDARRRHHHHSNDDDELLGTSWPPNGEHLAQDPDDDDDNDAEVDAQVARWRHDGRGGLTRRGRRGGGAVRNSRCPLINGSGGGGGGVLRRKNVMSVDACCSSSSTEVATTSMKRRGTLRHAKVVVLAENELTLSDEDEDKDTDDAELLCHFCNGLDDQPKNSSSPTDHQSNNANAN